MASYSFSASVIGRSDGRSAVASAAYRACERLVRAENGDTLDYRAKGGLVASMILAPADAPAWTRDRSQLWNAVEAKETRSNSQLARELRLALPLELAHDQRARLVHSWVERECVALGMVADVAIHDPAPAPGRSRNPHAHVMLTMRRTEGDGWAKNRERDWNAKGLLEDWRASWATAQNRALERVGSEARVDHRSLASQRLTAQVAGDHVAALLLDRPPEPRLGVRAGVLEARDPGSTERGRALTQARADRARAERLADELREAEEEFARAEAALREEAAAAAEEQPLQAPPQEDDPMAFDRTKTAVERQLRGLGLARVEISVIGGDRPHVQEMTPAEVLADLPRLRRANAAGCSVLVRGPRDEDHDLVLVDDITPFTAERMKADGLAPAVLVETSPGNAQAWIRLGEPTPAPVRHEVARELARRYGGDPGAVDPHQSGRLAGFTNPKHRKGGYAPFVLLHSFAGRAVQAARELLELAREAVMRHAPVHRIEPAPEASADLVAWWLQEQAAAPAPKDLSAIDWHLTHRALDAGHAPEDVAAALEATADRKGKAAGAYASRTVGKALSEREEPTPSDGADSDPEP